MMRRATLIPVTTLVVGLVMLCAASASADGGAAALGQAGRDFVPGQLIVQFDGGRQTLLRLPDGVSVATAAAALSRNDRVASAEPNYIAHAAVTSAEGWIPNDPGTGSSQGGWQTLQWNFLPCGSICRPTDPATGKPASPLPYEARGGIDAPRAWQILRARRRPGAAGVRVAVLDTGIAYRNLKPRYARSPDFTRSQFAQGYDFVGRDKFALDEDGHGTHVAGTIGEQTGNGKGLTGLAYGAKMIPVRVLDAVGEGRARDIGDGIRFAARHGAKVINMSFEFGGVVQSCRQVKTVCSAVAFARKRGAVVIAAAGNHSSSGVSFPARVPGVIGVGATTEGGCLADYSDRGLGLDLVAPGGRGEAGSVCRTPDLPVFQVTLVSSDLHRFGVPADYTGTSMSAAHASGVAAMVIASGVLGAHPTPARVACQLMATARTSALGEPYQQGLFGAGLIDAGAAVAMAAC